MCRLVFVAIGALFLLASLLPMQRTFTATADSSGERLAMYSKPAVVRIVDGAAGQVLFQPPGYQGQTYNVSAISLGSGFFISSNFPFWLVAIVLLVLFAIILLIIIAVVIFFVVRKRSKARKEGAAGPVGGDRDRPELSPAVYSPSPIPGSYSPSPDKASPAPVAAPPPGLDQGMTVDLSQTIAITADGDTVNYGAIRFVSGALAGKQFQIKPEGEFIGRDGSSAQIVIADPRISKRHLWIGVREGQVVIVDQSSRNGTFVNDPKSARVTETSLTAGDTVILGESDVARFEFLH